MGINTLRVGPLLCSDNVGMQISRDFCKIRSGWSFSFLFFLPYGLLVLHPENIYAFVGLHSRS